MFLYVKQHTCTFKSLIKCVKRLICGLAHLCTCRAIEEQHAKSRKLDNNTSHSRHEYISDFATTQETE